MNKKGLSPIIVSIILIAITVIVSVVVSIALISAIPVNEAPTIHVVISPITNEPNYPNGSYVVYYDDYFEQPTSYWKKGFDIAYTQFLAVQYATDKAHFVSSPVVIVAPTWFEQYFKNVTNAEGESVTYQWYG